jgi:hypothetical protein
MRFLGCVALLAPLFVRMSAARADEPQTPAVIDGQHGLAVIGLGSSVDAAWPLARAVYAEAALRPTTLDEAHARVLVGEAPDEKATAELRDLADTRAAIHGDDAASRRLLASIALSLHVKGILVVEQGTTLDARPTARVFVTAARAYDAVRYESDPPAPVTWGTAKSAVTWTGALPALRRGFADPINPPPTPPPPVAAVAAPVPGTGESAPPLATHAVVVAQFPSEKPGDRKPADKAFYQSPWFWAAAGAALFAAGAVYFATRDDGSDNIQLQVQVPK